MACVARITRVAYVACMARVALVACVVRLISFVWLVCGLSNFFCTLDHVWKLLTCNALPVHLLRQVQTLRAFRRPQLRVFNKFRRFLGI